MAEEESTEGEEEPKKKSKMMLFVIIGVVLLGGGGGAFFMMGGEEPKKEASEDSEEDGGEPERGEGDVPGAILPLEAFIVNLKVKGNFLKTSIQLEFYEAELPPTVEQDTPRIRDAIIRILSAKDAATILSPEGKDDLKEEMREEISDVLGGTDIANVFFTEFIVQ